MSTFLIACGGTGGHLSPGIALAQALVARGHRCTLLISTKPVDARLAEKYSHLDFVRIPGAGFSFNPLRLARFVGGQARAVAFASTAIRRLRPSFVVGFGGFTTAAVALAARAAGVPVALHEANRVPGRAIRLAGTVARRVYLPAGVRVPGLRASAVRACGMPVRRELARVTRSRARGALGLDADQKVLLVLGGSQGARPLNEWVAGALPQLARESIQVCCLTGPGHGAAGRFEHTSRDGRRVRSVFLPFSDDMATVLSAADLAVSRAGAGTIAELIRMKLPAILVPFPQAADNHQVFNARHFEQQGGGFVVDQAFIGDLAREIVEVIFNDWLLAQFALNLHRMDRDDPAELIADDLVRLLREMPVKIREEAPVSA